MGARKILNRQNIRAFILDTANHLHPTWYATRVEPELIDAIEYKVQEMIRKGLKNHPPSGKTVHSLY